MKVQLGSPSSRMSVGASDDPYKKYWWAILGGFVLTGAWLCLPVMETGVGSAHIDTSKPAVDPNAAQSLDSVDNQGVGAAGGALDLSMDGVAHKSKSDQAEDSMLYQAPPEVGAAAAGAPLGEATAASARSASLAQQLKDAGKQNAAGWNEKAQRGFDAPHLGGGALGGMGAVSGGSSASAGGPSTFGTNVAQASFGATKGLHDDGSDKPAGGGMQALRNAASAASLAAATRSGDAAHNSMSKIFDGAKAQASIGVPAGPGGAGYEALDDAPVNLKLNDPKLDTKNEKDPPAVNNPPAPPNNMGQQMAMMLASVVIGGLIPGVGGQMAMMMGMMMMQQQQAAAQQAAATKASACQQKVQTTGSSSGC